MAPRWPVAVDALLRLWDWQRSAKALPGHKLETWHFIQMVKWLRVAAVIKPCSSGMCEMVSAAKHCRTSEFGRSVSAPMDTPGSSDQTVRLWDMQDGSSSEPQGHIRVGFGQSSRLPRHTLASGSSDQTVRLWDVQDGSCLKILQDIRVGFGQSRLADGHTTVAAMIKPCGYGMCKTERA